MAEPQTFIEVYHLIDQKVGASCGSYSRDEHIETMFEEAKRRHPFMAGKNLDDFYHYHAARLALERQRELSAPSHTANELWDAAYALGTDRPWTPSGLDWDDFIDSDRFDPIPLGKMWGEYRFWLLPAAYLRCPGYGTLAINYPDGHPSEDEIRLSMPGLTSSQELLRSFATLGWIWTTLY